MKKLIITLILIGFANAGGYIESSEPQTTDEYVSADTNISRDGYMPRLIATDELKSGFYGGLGLSLSALSANGYPSLLSSKSGNNRMIDLSFVAGYNFNKYLSAESRAYLSAAYNGDVDFKSVALFLKPQYEVYKNVDLYSLIGVGRIMANNINDSKLKVGKTTMQVGVGADYKLKDNFKIFADYIYQGRDGKAKYNNAPAIIKSSAITTGITYDF